MSQVTEFIEESHAREENFMRPPAAPIPEEAARVEPPVWQGKKKSKLAGISPRTTALVAGGVVLALAGIALAAWLFPEGRRYLHVRRM
jgi:hypothetical protein